MDGIIEVKVNAPVVKRAKWKTLLALSLGYFVDQGEGQAMSIFSPVLRQLWGLSFKNLSWITFIRSLLQSLSSPFWGYLADRYSRKKVLFWERFLGAVDYRSWFDPNFQPIVSCESDLGNRFGLSDASYFFYYG